MVSRHAGFTLVEILIVMLITSVLVLGIHAAYRQAHALWSRAEDDREACYLTRVLTEVWREELSGLYMPSTNPEDEEGAGPGVFRLISTPDGGTELRFFTLTPAWRSDVECSRPAMVSYGFSRDRDTGRTMLQRSEVLCAGEKLIGRGSSEVLTEDLRDFAVWVCDPNGDTSPDAWTDSYESKDRPPRAARILLRWKPRNPEDPHARAAEFVSTVSIPCEGPLVPKAG